MNVFYRLPEGFPLEEAVQRFPQIFRPRQADSHKGTFGTLAVLGGAAGMSGAVVLASSSALMLGCGKVWAGFHQPVLPMPLLTTVWMTVAHAASPNMELAKSVFDPRIMSNAVESPVPGLYQFAQGNEVFYISADGRYVMQGEMIDLQTQINVTETFRASERVKTLAALDPKTMISVVPNARAYHITVFTDVDCT